MKCVVNTSRVSRMIGRARSEVAFPVRVSDSSTAKKVSTAATTLPTGYPEALSGLADSTTLQRNECMNIRIFVCMYVCMYWFT